MEENKEKKVVTVSLGGYVFLIVSFIIFVLVVGIGIGFCANKKLSTKSDTMPAVQNEVKNEIVNILITWYISICIGM